MPTLKIDGREITVDRGTSVLEAAKALGIQIPTFCYHPGLSKPANCRMCLVEMTVRGRPAPKPQPACHAQVADEMEVFTDTEHIQQTRKSVLEFILLNHPVDCPICDQAGECVLQDHYFKYSHQQSRLGHTKVHKAKAKRLGPDIMLDAERCILCTRCVRFCDEIAGQSQITVAHRGEHSEITTFPGEELDNPYAGNVVDICPVGALTSKDFRFRTRVWLLQSAESVCPECSRGCKIRVDTFQNVARRFKPAHNPRINDWWMCDDGRRACSRWSEDRAEGPAAPVDGKRRVVSVGHALQAAIDLLRGKPAARVGLVLTPWLTNEDAWLVARLAAEALPGCRVYLGGRADGEQDEILRRADKNPNSRGVQLMLQAHGVGWQPLDAFSADGLDTLLVLGDQLELGEERLEAFGKVPHRVVAGLFLGPLWRDVATIFLPARSLFEKLGTVTNSDGHVQRLDQAIVPSGTCKSEGWYALELAKALGVSELAEAYRRPEDIFADLARRVPGFAGMTWDGLRPHGIVLGAATDASASERPAAPATA